MSFAKPDSVAIIGGGLTVSKLLGIDAVYAQTRVTHQM